MISPKHSLGQHFLVDKKVIKDLVETAKISKDDMVLEIGAGSGNVTREIAKRARKVIAVEFDRDLIPVLKTNLAEFNNVTIINKDILKLDFSALEFEIWDLEFSTIVGSIPYQITSPLIHKLLGAGDLPAGKANSPKSPSKNEGSDRLQPGFAGALRRRLRQGEKRVTLGEDARLLSSPAPVIVLLIQKEVAEKITAHPPNATYLSNFVQAFAEVEIVRNVSKTAFKPQPKVDGAIVKITNISHSEFISESDGKKMLNQVQHDEPIQDTNIKISPKEWSAFLHRGFSRPRKMLRNTFDENILKKANINPRARPQELTVEEWITLYRTQLQEP